MRYLHTMVRVTDLDASFDFYCNKLGLTEVRRIDSDKGRFSLVFLCAPDDVELAQKNQAPLGRTDPQLGSGGLSRAGAISAISPIASTTSMRPASG